MGSSFCSCKSVHHDKLEVELALKNFDRLLPYSNADSLTSLFTPDASINETHDKEVIHLMFSYTAGGRNISRISTIDSIEIKDNSAIGKGKFEQIVVLGERDTVKVAGHFTTTLQCSASKKWLIKSMNETRDYDK